METQNITATVTRRDISSFSEHRVDDPNFVKEVNPKESTVLVELSYLTNPERLVGNAKHYFDTILKNNLYKGNGVLLFSTKSNLNLKNRMNVKNQLKTFVMEDCFLNILTQQEYIEKIEQLVLEIENEYKRKLDDNIKTFAQNALDFTCPTSSLTLTVVCSSYASTYGELSSFNNARKTEKPVQLELTYSFNDKSLSDELQHCRVRFEAPLFIHYLKTFAKHFLRQIYKVQIQTYEDQFEDDISSYIDMLPDIPDIVETTFEEATSKDSTDKGPTKPKRTRNK